MGYSYTDLGQTGIELYRNAALNGESNADDLQAILDQLQGKRRQGDEVITTLVPHAQQVALAALGEHHGAVVALEPQTGAVTVMASSPGFNPNRLSSVAAYQRLAHDSSRSPLVNRATEFGYAPGSTFKVVTATAAIDTGQYTPESLVSGRDGILVSGVPLSNDDHENFGELTLTQGLVKSVNTVYAQVAEHVGKSTLATYMRRFGFDRKPQVDLPAEELSASGEYLGQLIPPTSRFVDVGRMGIGQDKLEVTPLQMAQVAAAVANRGRLMAPHLTARIVDPEGRTVLDVTPRVSVGGDETLHRHRPHGMMEAVVQARGRAPPRDPGVRWRARPARPRPRSAPPSTRSGSSPSPPSTIHAWRSR